MDVHISCMHALTHTHSDHASFSDFARDQIMQLPFAVPLPEEGSVFDYFLDLNHYQFIPWSERKGASKHHSRGYVSSSEVCFPECTIVSVH